MAVAVIILLINVVMTSIRNVKVGNDPWNDGRTLEWAIPSPPPEHNFDRLPLVRGYDTWWIEKMEGRKSLTPAEPLGDIHMPSGSILPIFISLGLFIAAFGALYNATDKEWTVPVMIIGLLITFGAMLVRAMKDDPGYHIHKEDLIASEHKDDKGVDL